MINSINTLCGHDEVTRIIDVFYVNNQLRVLTSGFVSDVALNISGHYMYSTQKIIDSNRNCNLFTFDTEFNKLVTIKFDNTEFTCNVEHEMYPEYEDETLVTTVCNLNFNSIFSIERFVKYHSALGCKIILHERSGRDLTELYSVLKSYVESNTVILIDWHDIEYFQHSRGKENGYQTFGELSHTNHTLHLFPKSKYIIWLHIDELLVPPKGIRNITKHLDKIVEKNKNVVVNAMILSRNDFKNPNEGLPYYKSNTLTSDFVDISKLVYVTKNVVTIEIGGIGLGRGVAIDIDASDLCYNHYPFLDKPRHCDTVIGYLDNLDYTLFD